MASNGRLDLSTLTAVPLSSGGFGYLEKGTAAGWFAAREDIIRSTGTIPVIINDGLYRDYARQVYWKQYWTRLGKPLNAATPGTSNHGLGTAIDINNISAYNQRALDAAMGRHGFVRDTSESWHYHHTSTNPADSGSKPIPEEIPEPKEEDMKIYEDLGSTAPGGQSGIFWACAPGNVFKIVNSDYGTNVRAILTAAFNTPVGLFTNDLGHVLNTWLALGPTVSAGAFTPTDRAMLDDIANKGELGAALTNTVNLVNSHADANKAQIIQEIDTHGGTSGTPSAFTATITPVD